MAIIGVFVSLVMSGIMPFEISYTVQEMINSFILQIVGMGVYYVAIRWMSSLIYDKIHDISILHGELKNKDLLINSSITGIDKSVDVIISYLKIRGLID